MADNEERKQPETLESQENPYKAEDKETSETADKVSDGQGGEGEGTKAGKDLSFMETEEFKQAVLREAQSIADKSTATARMNALKEAREAKAEAEKIKREAELAKEQERIKGATEALASKFLESGISEDAVRLWKADRYALSEAMQAQKRLEADYVPKIERANRLEAAETAITSVLGEDALTRLSPSEYQAVVQAAEGDTLKEKIAYAKIKILELNKTVTKKPSSASKARKPDAGVSGSPGKTRELTAEDVKNMSPQERWERRNEIAKLSLGLGTKT